MIKSMPTRARSAALDDHAAAAGHHRQSAAFHRGAGRHFQVGKESDQAAHQAALAHGHALLAIAFGGRVAGYYCRHHGNIAGSGPGLITRAAVEAAEAALALRPGLGVSAHHERAAAHHERAAHLHLKAKESCDASDFSLALSDTGSACTEARCALFHSDEAARPEGDHPQA